MFPLIAAFLDYPSCSRRSRTWTREIDGSVTQTEQFRLARKIPSNNYVLEAQGIATILPGRGEGHGVGLCQNGASAMASSGASFRDILNHYYSNTTCSR